jgi:hypothetical protein
MSHWAAGLLLYGQGGPIVTAAAVLLGAAGSAVACRPVLRTGAYLAGSIVCVYALAAFTLSAWYLTSPTYIDHIEASTASDAQYFLQGVPLYPDVRSYTFHGLLYGPLLAELSSLGYAFGSDVFASKLIGWVAAWLAMAIMLLTPRRAERTSAWVAASAWGIYVLISFGEILTADRSDSLLLLCAALALSCATRLGELPALAMVALLAGASADLKLHGPVYVAPALAVWASRYPLRTRGSLSRAAAVAAIAAAVGCLAPFVPSNVSLAGYLTYVKLASRQGLSVAILVSNLAFLVSLWVPALLLALAVPTAVSRFIRIRLPFLGVLLAAELATAIIGSKPGAGPHHLLPFVVLHAFILRQLITEACGRSARRLPIATAVLAGLVATIVGMAAPSAAGLRRLLKFDLQLPQQRATLAELSDFARRYPGGMMGIAGPESYDLTNYRPWLTLQGIPQTDYGALMDLRLSGVDEAPLADALARCEIPYLFVPKGGPPYSMSNNYGSGPLFSDAVRASFARRFALVESGRYFRVFRCAHPLTHPSELPHSSPGAVSSY